MRASREREPADIGWRINQRGLRLLSLEVRRTPMYAIGKRRRRAVSGYFRPSGSRHKAGLHGRGSRPGWTTRGSGVGSKVLSDPRRAGPNGLFPGEVAFDQTNKGLVKPHLSRAASRFPTPCDLSIFLVLAGSESALRDAKKSVLPVFSQEQRTEFPVPLA